MKSLEHLKVILRNKNKKLNIKIMFRLLIPQLFLKKKKKKYEYIN